MLPIDESNDSSPSTRWEWRQVKVRPTAGGQKDARRRRGRFFGLPPRNPRQPLTLTIKFRGGPECWYEVHARGQIVRYPGVRCLHEIMDEINTGAGQREHGSRPLG